MRRTSFSAPLRTPCSAAYKKCGCAPFSRSEASSTRTLPSSTCVCGETITKLVARWLEMKLIAWMPIDAFRSNSASTGAPSRSPSVRVMNSDS